MKQTQSLALVGAGYWGKNLARNFHTIGVFHSICDTNEALLDQYQSQYPDVKLTSNFTTVLENGEIDRIVIAAPAFQHYSLAKQALLAGKDVYVEKPLCLDSQEAEELIKIADEKGLVLMVGHLLHYHPCVKKLQELVATGELGKVQYISSNRLNLGSYRTEENALWNFAPHDVSVILSLCHDQMPKVVRCMGAAYLSKGVADTTLTTLDFGEELKAHIYVSWLNPFKEQKLVVVGSHGMAVFDDTKPWGEKLLLYKNHVKWQEGNIPVANKSEPIPVDPPEQEPLRQECLHFLACCEERTEPRTDGREGLRVLNVLQAAQESLEQNGIAKDPVALHAHSLYDPQYDAHPTAVIDPKAVISPGVKIWHFSHVMNEARIGKNSKLGQNVVVSPGVVLGENVKVQNNVSIYSGVVCEDHVFLGPSIVFTNILNPRSEFPRRDQYVNTYIRKGATIGANATVLCGIEIGRYAFIGAGAIVTKNVKPYALILGNPGKQVGWMSRAGHKLDLPVEAPAGEELEAKCPQTGEAYVLSGGTLSPNEKSSQKVLN